MEESIPPIRRAGDRTYDVLSDVDDLARLFRLLGFRYEGKGAPGDIWQHRWHHDGPNGRTMLIVFRPYGDKPPRLALLGPHIGAVDALTNATIEQDATGGRWLAFGGTA